jgi:seryl-tRNA synthetase
MKTVELQEKEINEANFIIEKYKNVDTSLRTIEKQLEALDKQRADVMRKLENIQKEEVKFFKKLKKKHGEGRLDLYTMKYVINNEPDKES